MSVIRLGTRAALAILLLSLAALTASGDCINWECKKGIDTATCWQRFGPNAAKFNLGADCSVVSQCIWYYELETWSVTCSYDCQITTCYEV